MSKEHAVRYPTDLDAIQFTQRVNDASSLNLTAGGAGDVDLKAIKLGP